MSHQVWTERYARDPGAVGATYFVMGKPVTVVGVAAESFFGETVRPDPAGFWIPVGQEPMLRGGASILDRPGSHWLYAIGRIAPGAAPAQIQTRATGLVQQWLSAQSFVSAESKAEIAQQRVDVVSASGGVELMRYSYAQPLNLLFGTSALVLLITAANLANLLLARADRGQAALRAALGASSGAADPSVAHRRRHPLCRGRAGRARSGDGRDAGAPGPRISRGRHAGGRHALADRACVHRRPRRGDRRDLHRRAGLGDVTNAADRSAARRRTQCGVAVVGAAAIARDRPGRVVHGPAGERRSAGREPESSRTSAARVRSRKPGRRAHRAARARRSTRQARRVLSIPAGPVAARPRRPVGDVRALQPDGRQQLVVGHQHRRTSRRSSPDDRLLVESRRTALLRNDRHTPRSRPLDRRARHPGSGARRRRQLGVRPSVLRERRSDRPPAGFRRREPQRRLGDRRRRRRRQIHHGEPARAADDFPARDAARAVRRPGRSERAGALHPSARDRHSRRARHDRPRSVDSPRACRNRSGSHGAPIQLARRTGRLQLPVRAPDVPTHVGLRRESHSPWRPSGCTA